MAHLIQTLNGDEELDLLQHAYVVLAEAYLEHRTGRTESAIVDGSFASLRKRVLASEDNVDVGLLCRHKCDLIGAKKERPVELFNNLGQVEVLIAAIKIMRDLGLKPTKSAPTQQSQDKDGNGVSDLEGEGWKLEAFGGQNCTSNQKLFEDLCTLKTTRRNEDRMFLAFRQTAWNEAYKSKRLSLESQTSVGGTTKKVRSDFDNRKVNVQAEIQLRGTHEDICVCEVLALDCVPSQKKSSENESVE